MQCEMCGADSGLVFAEIEGARLQVCRNCAQFGRILGEVRGRPSGGAKPGSSVAQAAAPQPKPIILEESAWTLVSDYAERIQKRRESLKMKQEDLAKKVAEKESLIHKIETGAYEPRETLARKLERALGITLLEKVKQAEGEQAAPKAKPVELTFGDIISVRKKKA